MSVAACVLSPAAAGAYEFQVPKFNWTGDPAVIKYHSKIEADAWSVKRAVEAWNENGPDVRFKSVPADEAKVIIKYFSDAEDSNFCNGDGDEAGLATIELTASSPSGPFRASKAKVLLDKYRGSPPECRYSLALVTTHELGHVVGLGHEDDKCAVMNSLIEVDYPGAHPWACDHRGPSQWWCRRLAEDDLKGAKALYGGVYTVRSPQYCSIDSTAAAAEGAGSPPARVPIDDGPIVTLDR